MEKQQKKAPPNIVISNTALKLAEKWVSTMAESKDDEHAEAVGRPDRLGLGAKVPRHTKIGQLDDPLEKRLYAKLGAQNINKAAKESTTLTAPKKNEIDNDDDSDADDSESRTQVFGKKRPANLATTPLRTKKRK